MSEPRVEVSPFSKGHGLSGFVVSGRWPSSTREWAQFLALAVRLAAVPGMVHTTTVFRAIEDVPDNPQPGTVGRVTLAGPVLGDGAPQPGAFSAATPPALLLLHPPEESRPSTPEVVGAASGCVLLPGLPGGLGVPGGIVPAAPVNPPNPPKEDPKEEPKKEGDEPKKP